MKHLIPTLFCVLALALSACASIHTSTHTEATKDDAQDPFDPELANALGADDYGMRSYVLVVLKTGPTVIDDKVQRNKVFSGHFANMKRLGTEGLLVLAGPFIEGGDKRGLYVFNVVNIDEARELVKTDPAVAAGVFVPEFTKFYGTAALMKINEIHRQIQKTKIS